MDRYRAPCFSARRIGCFRPGCEASLLVFTKDPCDDIDNLSTLKAGIKQGVLVTGTFAD